MDPARQVIRWSIPGAVFLLFLGIFQLMTALSRDRSFRVLETLPNVRDTALSLVAALLSSVPIGFLIYQFYYYAYGKGTYFRNLARSDRGAEVLRALPPDLMKVVVEGIGVTPYLGKMYRARPLLPGGRFPVLLLKPQYRNRSGRRRYTRRRLTNWSIVRTLLDLVCIKSGSEELKREYTTVSDIYHAQGATRTSLLFALSAYLGYNLYANYDRLGERLGTKAVTLALIFGFSAFFFYVASRGRAHTFKSMQSTLKYGFRVLAREEWVYALVSDPPRRLDLLKQALTPGRRHR